MEEVQTEYFLVEVPVSSGLVVGDFVMSKMEVSLRSGWRLGRGMVIKVDEDPSQDIMPLFFVEGVRTGIRSVLGIDALSKTQHYSPAAPPAGC